MGTVQYYLDLSFTNFFIYLFIHLSISEKKLTINKFSIKSKCKYKHYKKVQIQVKHNIQKQED